jgi:hypothetical protein
LAAALFLLYFVVQLNPKNMKISISKFTATAAAFSVFVFSASAITDAMKIKIAYGSYSDETVVRFMSGATTGFNGCCDAYKLFSSNTAVPNIFTKSSEGYELSINANPPLTYTHLQEVFLRIGVAATYTISSVEVGAFAPNICIQMKDNATGQLYDLRTQGTWLISLPVIAQTDPARFIVLFSYPASVQVSDASCTACTDGEINIDKSSFTGWQYALTNSSGNTVASGTSSLYTATIAGLSAGSYTLNLSNAFSCNETFQVRVGPVTYYSRTNGNWSDTSSWSTAACGGAAASAAPSAGDNAVICTGNTVTVNVISACNDLTINGTLSCSAELNVKGNMINNGTFSA